MKKVIGLLLVVSSLFGYDYYHLIDIDNNLSKKSMKSWLDGDFGLKPYKVNYLLPYGVADHKYYSRVPSIQFKNIEAELQVSLKLQVGYNFMGLDEKYYLSYTHQAFWQIYITSSPFRESVYNPEGFVIFPIKDETSIFGFNSLKLALAHRSNGQPDTKTVVFSNGQALGNLSRSVNYVYATLRLQHTTLMTDFTVWGRIPENKSTDDNPDIMDYVGYSSVKFTYFLNKHMFTFMARGNFETKKGAIEATYSYPLIYNNFFVKFFSGYAESLIDYNQNITKLSVGFSFSR